MIFFKKILLFSFPYLIFNAVIGFGAMPWREKKQGV
jgi:hypothetical protein